MDPRLPTQTQDPKNLGIPFFLHQSQIPAGEIKYRHLVATNVIAKGDMVYGDGTNNFLRIPAPSGNGNFLQFLSGIPKWSNTLPGTLLLIRTAVNDTNYTVLLTDYLIAYTAISAGRTVTIPTAIGNSGKTYIVKDEAGAANAHNLTLSAAAGNIDGAASLTMNVNYQAVRLYSNGANWFTW